MSRSRAEFATAKNSLTAMWKGSGGISSDSKCDACACHLCGRRTTLTLRMHFRRYHYVDEKPVPKLHEVVMLTNLDAEVRASGFDEDKRHNLLVCFRASANAL